MLAEDIGIKTRNAWDEFNTTIRKWPKRNEPGVKKSLQILYQHQRRSFAHDSRQTKNKRKRIKKNEKLSTGEREKRLDELRRFDPSKWPEKSWKEIRKAIKKERTAQLEAAVARMASGTSSSSHGGHSSNNKKEQRDNSRSQSGSGQKGAQQRRPFQPDRPCPKCGSKAQHNTRNCMAEYLAADNTKPTIATNNHSGYLVRKDGNKRICTGYNLTQTAQPNAASTLQARLLPKALRLKPEGWDELLQQHGLSDKYTKLVQALREGLDIGIKPIARTYTAKHHQSALLLPHEVQKIIDKEIKAHRYAGPFDQQELRDIVGEHFQTSPLGLRPKPNGKFRPIQDFSHGRGDIPSVNSTLNPDDWPTTWCAFKDMCTILLMHPRTTQAYVRDVTSAFRQIPLHPSQWASTVVEWEGKYYIDLFLAVGLGPACGAYGLFADAYADIVRTAGIAATAHWVDDNVFLRVPQEELQSLNERRAAIHSSINPIPQHSGGRTYWVDQQGREYTEDYQHPVILQHHAEEGYHMGLGDIDHISEKLGWPWEPEKDAPWASVFRYAGIVYNIATREVSLPESKRLKYLQTIADIRKHAEEHEGRYRLQEIERLHGQCQWASHVFTKGKWHVKSMQDFMRSASEDPSMRYQWRRGSEDIERDIAWWDASLQQSNYCRSFDPTPPADYDCYCDGSTSYGVGLSIQGRERAYPLRKQHVGVADIKTVEALALELAVLTLAAMGYRNQAVLIHTDNTAVFHSFKKGRMAAVEPNTVLARIAEHEVTHKLPVHLKWVDTKSQRADAPSRGKSSSCLDRLPVPSLDPKLSYWFDQSW